MATHQQPYTFFQTPGCGDYKTHGGEIRLVPSFNVKIFKLTVFAKHAVTWQKWVYIDTTSLTFSTDLTVFGWGGEMVL